MRIWSTLIVALAAQPFAGCGLDNGCGYGVSGSAR